MIACTPHPGLGAVIVRQQQIDLATCKTSSAHGAPGPSRPTVVVFRHGDSGTQSIVWHGRIALTIHESYRGFPAGSPGPIEIQGTSPDGKWILYAIDPMGSASLAADGLTLRAVRVTGGRSYTVASGLLYEDYRGWCDGKLAMTAGGDRYAAHHKWLIVTRPPSWKARRIAVAPAFAFGTLACRGNGIVVQATRDLATTTPRWELWELGLEGGMSVLDTPPPGWSDESPEVASDGTIYFVRSRTGDNGKIYALRNGSLVGPLLELPATDGYYGHTAWPYAVRR